MLASGVVLGLVAGLAIGRSWRPLAAVQVRWLPLLIAGLVARAAASVVPPIAFPLYLFALAGTAASAAVNRRLAGALLVALGGALNLLVVLLNHGMPVDAGAVVAAAASMPADALHVPLTGATVFPALADVIPVPIARSVYSLGDFCIALGGFLVPFVLLIRR
ncbi:MAG TPA: DUF5317 family protein [Candidatus Limnocylindria bacterium]|nr:DUF5317 family protein [Candidatus Limnocylindria bacterium]